MTACCESVTLAIVETKAVGMSPAPLELATVLNSPHPVTTIVLPASTKVEVKGVLVVVEIVFDPAVQLASVMVISS